jgi:uncharacterized protein YbbK (DUF523 family)
MIAVSACLAGQKCRYNGEAKGKEDIIELVRAGRALCICPEVMGGLGTPRPPAEIIGERVLNLNGEDVTDFFVRGAEKALELMRDLNISEAILKARSPSCGCTEVYDGSFTGSLKKGSGITARLLKENGIMVSEL